MKRTTTTKTETIRSVEITEEEFIDLFGSNAANYAAFLESDDREYPISAEEAHFFVARAAALCAAMCIDMFEDSDDNNDNNEKEKK